MADLLAPAAPPAAPAAAPAVHAGWTLADTVTAHPLAGTVVRAFGLDPARQGTRTLAEAAAANDVDLEALLYCLGSVVCMPR